MDIRSHHLFAAKDEQLPSQSGGTIRSVSNLLGIFRSGLSGLRSSAIKSAVTDNYAKNVIKVMRDTAGELADHFHFCASMICASNCWRSARSSTFRIARRTAESSRERSLFGIQPVAPHLNESMASCSSSDPETRIKGMIDHRG
jgi:hypothetical protein